MSTLSPPTVQEYQHLKKTQLIIPPQQDLKKRVSSSFFLAKLKPLGPVEILRCGAEHVSDKVVVVILERHRGSEQG